jgi:hypothetical protein
LLFLICFSDFCVSFFSRFFCPGLLFHGGDSSK